MALALTSIEAAANTVPVPGEGVSITIPDDWVLLNRPDLALVAAAPGETTALGITVKSNNDHLRVDNSRYFVDLERDLLEKSAKSGTSIKIIDSGPRNLNGVPAAFMESEEVFSGNMTVYDLVYHLAANGKFYHLTLDTRDSFQVPALEKIAESLRFDHPPAIPPLSATPHFIEHRLMEIAGVVLVLVVVVWIIRRLIQHFARS